MFFSVALAGFFAGFSPFWGLFIIVAYGFRHYQKNSNACLGTFAAAAVISAFMFSLGNTGLELADAIVGTGVAAGLYFYFLKASKKPQVAFLYASGYGVAYGALRQLFFGQIIKQQLQQSSAQSLDLMKELFSGNPEMISLAEQSAKSSMSFFLNFGISIWFAVILLALYLGSLWFTRKEVISWEHEKFSLPFFFIYVFIAAMILFLLPVTKIAGANLIFITIPYLIIQGIAVLFYFWKAHTENNKFLLYFLLVSILFNYILFIALTILGIADFWFMFRQRHQNRLKQGK